MRVGVAIIVIASPCVGAVLAVVRPYTGRDAATARIASLGRRAGSRPSGCTATAARRGAPTAPAHMSSRAVDHLRLGRHGRLPRVASPAGTTYFPEHDRVVIAQTCRWGSLPPTPRPRPARRNPPARNWPRRFHRGRWPRRGRRPRRAGRWLSTGYCRRPDRREPSPGSRRCGSPRVGGRDGPVSRQLIQMLCEVVLQDLACQGRSLDAPTPGQLIERVELSLRHPQIQGR